MIYFKSTLPQMFSKTFSETFDSFLVQQMF